MRRRAPRAPAAPCRETYARASSRSRPRKEHGASHAPRLRAPSGCCFSGDPRRAIDRRVGFPSKRSIRSGFAPDARGCVRGREAVAGGRTDADPMLARRNTRDFFRLPGSPAPGSRDRLFFMVHEPCARSASPRGVPNVVKSASRFGRGRVSLSQAPTRRRARGSQRRAPFAPLHARDLCAPRRHTGRREDERVSVTSG